MYLNLQKKKKKFIKAFLIYLYQQITILFSDLYTVSSNADLKNNFKALFNEKKHFLLENWVGEVE